MACGLPVIATKCGGPESIINDDKVGRLVDINVDDLSKAMIEIEKNIGSFNTQYIREYAVENFSEKTITYKLEKFYNDVLLP